MIPAEEQAQRRAALRTLLAKPLLVAVGVGDQQGLGQQGEQRGPALCPLLSRDHDTLMAPGP